MGGKVIKLSPRAIETASLEQNIQKYFRILPIFNQFSTWKIAKVLLFSYSFHKWAKELVTFLKLFHTGHSWQHRQCCNQEWQKIIYPFFLSILNFKNFPTEGEEEFLQDLEHEFPLHDSVFQGNSRKLLFLLKQGIDVTRKDKHGTVE